MEPMVVERAFVISGGGMKHRVTVPASDTKDVDGKTYVHLAKSAHYIASLLANRIGSERALARTDVVETITELRNAKLRAMVAKHDPQEQCSIFKPKVNVRISVSVKARLPTSVEVTLPKYGDIPGRPISVLLGNKTTAPLYVALTGESIAHLRKVCQWQIQDGSIKRRRLEKKVPCDIEDPPEDCEDAEGDDDYESAHDDSPPTVDHHHEDFEMIPSLVEQPCEQDGVQDDSASTHDSHVGGDLVEGGDAITPPTSIDCNVTIEATNAPVRTHSIASYFRVKQ
jgi:hypothetical protein